MNWPASVVVSVLLCVFLFSCACHEPELNVSEFTALREQRKILLVDVRTTAEREVSIIPGAISAAAFEQQAKQLANVTIVTYCTAGLRSGKYALLLRQKGFNAVNLSGGILAWTNAHLPLVRPDGSPTTRVHVFDEKWDLAPAEYQTTW